MPESWLKDLEDKVREASKTLRTLREENGELKERVEELEVRLKDQAKEAAKEGAKAPESRSGGSGRDDWRAEREEIKERVEKLAGHLSELLGEE